MNPQNKRGLTRLGFALGIPYFGWWGMTYWSANAAVPKYIRWSREAADREDWNASTIWMQAANDASSAMTRSILWGLVAPVLLLVAAAIGYWVYRGFKPKTSRDGECSN